MDTIQPETRGVKRAGPLRAEVSAALIRKVDLCRGLFAFLVVAAHAYDVCWSIHPEAISALPEPVRLALFATVQCGYYWVMGFFVISGYCIQLSVGRQVESGRFSFWLYLAARLTRIMPLYYAGLLFALAVEVLVAPIRASFYPDGLNHVGWLSQLIFAQRFFQTFGSFAPSWTITYELFYYVFFGLLAALTTRFRGRPAWHGMALCVVLGGIMQWLYLHGEKNGLTLHVGQIFGLGSVWFMGALIAVHGPALARLRPARVVATSWPLILASAVAAEGQRSLPGPVDLPCARRGVLADDPPLPRRGRAPRGLAGPGPGAPLAGDDGARRGPGQLSDLPLPRPAPAPDRLDDLAMGVDRGLAGELAGDDLLGDRPRAHPGLVPREADHGLAGRMARANEGSSDESGGRDPGELARNPTVTGDRRP